MDREAWRATVHGVTKNQTRLSAWAQHSNHKFIFHVCGYISVLYWYISSLVSFFFKISHISGIMIFVIVCLAYFTYLLHILISLCPPMLLQWHYSILFYGWVVFHFVYVPHLLYPFICWCTFRWLPVLAIVNSTAVNIRVRVYFWIMVSSRYMPRSVIAASYKIWKTHQWARDWKWSVFIPIPKKGNAKECSKWSEVKWKSLTHVWLFVAPLTIQSMEFSRPEYWSG